MSAPLTLAAQVAMLNDAFRHNPFASGVPGMLVITSGVADLSPDRQGAILATVVAFDAFDDDNDPYRERDFGAFDIEGERIFWKIDVYTDSDCTFGSEFPADPQRSYRVLTIMFAREY